MGSKSDGDCAMKFTEVVTVNLLTGLPLPGASVYVYLTGTGTLATLYSLNGSPISNPVISGSTGLIGFQVADGTYDIQWMLGAYTSPLIQAVQIYDGRSNAPGNVYKTSQYGTYPLADAAAFAASGEVVVNTACVLTGSYVTLSSSVKFDGGSITLGNYNLTMPQDTEGPIFGQIFNQNGTGQVTFSGIASANVQWWLPSAPNTTQVSQAFQACATALDGYFGSTAVVPPATAVGGAYIFNASLPVLFRNNHWKRHPAFQPRSVRLTFDKTTVPTAGTGLFAQGNAAIFITAGGPPSAQLFAGQYLSGHTRITGQQCGAIDPTTVCGPLQMSGIDFVSADFGGGFLGANKFFSAVNWSFVYGGLIDDCLFIGFPSGGLYGIGGNTTVISCKGWLNGFTAGTANGQCNRNGLDLTGWWDFINPSLTSTGTAYINPDVRANANDGWQQGGDMDNKVIGGTNIGNATAFEIYAGANGQNATLWTANTLAPQGQLFYTLNAGNLGGPGANIYYYTSNVGGQVTGSTAPTGTTIGANITDGTATCQFVGTMPDNGLVPSAHTMQDHTWDGTTLRTLDVPYLGIVNVPASLYSAETTGPGAFSAHGNNEARYRWRNCRQMNWGYSGGPSATGNLSTKNGGDIDIDGFEFVNCIGQNSGASGIFTMEVSTVTNGNALPNSGRVKLRNIRNLNGSGMTSNTAGIIAVSGNPTFVDIGDTESNGPSGGSNVSLILGNSGAVNYTIEALRLGRMYSAGETFNGIYLSFPENTTITNGIVLTDNKLYNLNQDGMSNTHTFLFINGPGTGGVLIGKLRIEDGNEASYSATTNYPVNVQNMPTISQFSIKAKRNSLNEGSFKLAFRSGISIVSPGTAAAFSVIDASDNGLLGERVSRQSGAPSTTALATWQADRFEIIGAATGQPWMYETTIGGGYISNLMSGCAATTQTSGNEFFPYTGTPPAVGEVFTFAAGSTGSYIVRHVDTVGGNIWVYPLLNQNEAASEALSYAMTTFKTSSLS